MKVHFFGVVSWNVGASPMLVSGIEGIVLACDAGRQAPNMVKAKNNPRDILNLELSLIITPINCS
jgi:hypothetical protein